MVGKKCARCKRIERGKNTKPYRRKPSGEGDLFKEIWESTPIEERVSFVTGLPLPDVNNAYSYYFSHVLKKGSYKHFRLYKKNIVFMTLEEHNTWEINQYKIKDDPMWSHVFKLKEELINEYKERF